MAKRVTRIQAASEIPSENSDNALLDEVPRRKAKKAKIKKVEPHEQMEDSDSLLDGFRDLEGITEREKEDLKRAILASRQETGSLNPVSDYSSTATMDQAKSKSPQQGTSHRTRTTSGSRSRVKEQCNKDAESDESQSYLEARKPGESFRILETESQKLMVVQLQMETDDQKAESQNVTKTKREELRDVTTKKEMEFNAGARKKVEESKAETPTKGEEFRAEPATKGEEFRAEPPTKRREVRTKTKTIKSDISEQGDEKRVTSRVVGAKKVMRKDASGRSNDHLRGLKKMDQDADSISNDGSLHKDNESSSSNDAFNDVIQAFQKRRANRHIIQNNSLAYEQLDNDRCSSVDELRGWASATEGGPKTEKNGQGLFENETKGNFCFVGEDVGSKEEMRHTDKNRVGRSDVNQWGLVSLVQSGKSGRGRPRKDASNLSSYTLMESNSSGDAMEINSTEASDVDDFPISSDRIILEEKISKPIKGKRKDEDVSKKETRNESENEKGVEPNCGERAEPYDVIEVGSVSDEDCLAGEESDTMEQDSSPGILDSVEQKSRASQDSATCQSAVGSDEETQPPVSEMEGVEEEHEKGEEEVETVLDLTNNTLVDVDEDSSVYSQLIDKDEGEEVGKHISGDEEDENSLSDGSEDEKKHVCVEEKTASLVRHYRNTQPTDAYRALRPFDMEAVVYMMIIQQRLADYSQRLRYAQQQLLGKLEWGVPVKSGQHQSRTIDAKKRGHLSQYIEMSEEEEDLEKEQDNLEVEVSQGRSSNAQPGSRQQLSEPVDRSACGRIERQGKIKDKQTDNILEAETQKFDHVDNNESNPILDRLGLENNAIKNNRTSKRFGIKSEVNKSLKISKFALSSLNENNDIDNLFTGDATEKHDRMGRSLHRRKKVNVHVADTQQCDDTDIETDLQLSKVDWVVEETQKGDDSDWLSVKTRDLNVKKVSALKKGSKCKLPVDKTNKAKQHVMRVGRKVNPIEKNICSVLIEDSHDTDEVEGLKKNRNTGRNSSRKCFELEDYSDSCIDSVADSQICDSASTQDSLNPARKTNMSRDNDVMALNMVLSPGSMLEDRPGPASLARRSPRLGSMSRQLTTDNNRNVVPACKNNVLKDSGELPDNQTVDSEQGGKIEPQRCNTMVAKEETDFHSVSYSIGKSLGTGSVHNGKVKRMISDKKNNKEEFKAESSDAVSQGVIRFLQRPASKESNASDDLSITSSQSSAAMLDETGNLYCTQPCHARRVGFKKRQVSGGMKAGPNDKDEKLNKKVGLGNKREEWPTDVNAFGKSGFKENKKIEEILSLDDSNDFDLMVADSTMQIKAVDSKNHQDAEAERPENLFALDDNQVTEEPIGFGVKSYFNQADVGLGLLKSKLTDKKESDFEANEDVSDEDPLHHFIDSINSQTKPTKMNRKQMLLSANKFQSRHEKTKAETIEIEDSDENSNPPLNIQNFSTHVNPTAQNVSSCKPPLSRKRIYSKDTVQRKCKNVFLIRDNPADEAEVETKHPAAKEIIQRRPKNVFLVREDRSEEPEPEIRPSGPGPRKKRKPNTAGGTMDTFREQVKLVSCPLCDINFPENLVEDHAASCQGPDQGEDMACVVAEPRSSPTGSGDIQQCYICDENIKGGENFDTHIKDCMVRAREQQEQVDAHGYKAYTTPRKQDTPSRLTRRQVRGNGTESPLTSPAPYGTQQTGQGIP